MTEEITLWDGNSVVWASVECKKTEVGTVIPKNNQNLPNGRY